MALEVVSLLLVFQCSVCAIAQATSYMNGTRAKSTVSGTPTYSFPLAEVTALDGLYAGVSDPSLRLYCESAILEASAQFQRPVATITATSTIAGSPVPYTTVSTDEAASVTAKPPCCVGCTISGNPAQLRYFPSAGSALSGASITVVDNFTYTSPSVYLILSSVRATDLCGVVGSHSTQMITLSFPQNYLYTYAGLVGNLDAPGETAESGLFNPTDLAHCRTTTTVFDVGPHYANPCSPFIVAPTELLDVDPAFSTCKLARLGFHDPPTMLTPAKYLAPPPTPPPVPGPSPTADEPKATTGVGQQPSDPKSPAPIGDPSDPSSNDPSPDKPSPDKPSPNDPSQNDPPPNNPAPNNPVPNKSVPNDPQPNHPALNNPVPNKSVPNDPPPNDPSTENPSNPSPNNPSPKSLIIDPTPIESPPKTPGTTPDVSGSNHQPQQLSPAVNQGDPGSNDQSQPAVPGAVPIPIPNPSLNAGQSLPKPSVISVLGQAFSVNSDSVFVAPSATLIPGGPPITISNTPVSLAPSANFVIVGSSTYAQKPAPTPAAAVLPLGATSITANLASQFIIGHQTLSPGGVVTVSGTPISLPSGSPYALVGSSTVSLIDSAVKTSEPRIMTFAGQSYTANPNNGAFVIGGQTVTPGGTITVAGTPIALGPTAAYAVVGTSTIPLQGNLNDIITFGSSTYTATSGSFTVAGQTLTPGGTITVSGTRISLSPLAPATPYAVIGSSTIPLGPAIVGPDVLTVGSQVYTANSLTDFVIAGQSLTPGGKITVNGTAVSLASGATDAVVGTSTVGIGGYIINGFNGGGGSNDGSNGSVVQFLGAGEGGNHLLGWALRATWLSFGVVLGMVEILVG